MSATTEGESSTEVVDWLLAACCARSGGTGEIDGRGRARSGRGRRGAGKTAGESAFSTGAALQTRPSGGEHLIGGTDGKEDGLGDDAEVLEVAVAGRGREGVGRVVAARGSAARTRTVSEGRKEGKIGNKRPTLDEQLRLWQCTPSSR
jgi:hypothetical protein